MNEWTGVIAATTVLLAAVGIFVATRQLRLQHRTLARDDAKEVLTGVIAPMLRKNRTIIRALDERRFYADDKSGWKELYGKPEGFADDLDDVQIGVHGDRPVYRLPGMDTTLREGVWYVPSSNIISLRFDDLGDWRLKRRIETFDRRLRESDSWLIPLAAEVARAIASVVGERPCGASPSDFARGRSLSDVWIIGWNHVLMSEETFERFLAQYERAEAKQTWQSKECRLVRKLATPAVQKHVEPLISKLNQLLKEAVRIEKEFVKIERRTRKQYRIPYWDVPPIL